MRVNLKTKKLNKIKKKIFKNYSSEPMRIGQEFRLNDRGEIVLVKSQSLDYDPFDIMLKRYDYDSGDYKTTK